MQLNDVAIIGHTGFIGSNMAKMVQADKFSSSNIHKIKEKEYETIYCCAPGATKWMINKAPEKDFQNIESLSHIIEKTNCKRFVLFSTIDVMTFKQKLSYGGNRLFFEKRIQEIYPKVSIIRLPGLFGPGLKKNSIFDLQKQRHDFINLNSAFQWLHVHRGIEYSLNSSSGLHELYTEPVETLDIVKKYFPESLEKCKLKNRFEYKIMPQSGYFQTREEVMKDLGDYLDL